MEPFTWLTTAAAWGLATAGTALIAKALTPGKWRRVKPFSCALCMSVWSALAVWIALFVCGAVPLTTAAIIPAGLRYLGAVAVSVFLIERTHLFAPPLPDFGAVIGTDGRPFDTK